MSWIGGLAEWVEGDTAYLSVALYRRSQKTREKYDDQQGLFI